MMTLFPSNCFLFTRRGTWNRIVAPFMPGVTTGNASGSQGYAFTKAMELNGFLGILRAAGIKTTARAEENADSDLIERDKFYDKSVYHREVFAQPFQSRRFWGLALDFLIRSSHNCWIISSICRFSNGFMLLRARITMSRPRSKS